jgi:hypothetical protein
MDTSEIHDSKDIIKFCEQESPKGELGLQNCLTAISKELLIRVNNSALNQGNTEFRRFFRELEKEKIDSYPIFRVRLHQEIRKMEGKIEQSMIGKTLLTPDDLR